MESTNHATDHGAGEGHYLKLGAMTAVMFIAMFALMYAMVDRVDNVYVNINQFYMAGLMTAAMVLIELAIMRGMYPRKGVNAGLAAVSALSFALFWVGIREQSAVSDRQFLRSMIPHHASAILMCEEAPVTDLRVRTLCGKIVSSQRAEILEMSALLDGDAGRN
jgi:uncharacterized protein (DUF305 family)